MGEPSAPPPDGPKGTDAASFEGGIHYRGLIGGVGAPVGGHLEFDREHLRLWGLGFDVRVARQDVRAVKFSLGIAVVRISVVPVVPAPEQMFWFSTRKPDPVRAALGELGWPVIDDPTFDLGVSDTDEI